MENNENKNIGRAKNRIIDFEKKFSQKTIKLFMILFVNFYL